jgi:preprotein translocase subunit SecA
VPTLTDKGFDYLAGTQSDPTMFVLPDITAEMSELENEHGLTEEQKLERKIN